MHRETVTMELIKIVDHQELFINLYPQWTTR